jgi:hypothetical protein
VKFILENKSPLVKEESDYDFSECRMQHYLKYIDADGKKEKVSSKLKEYGFTYAGRDFIYRLVKVPLSVPIFNKTETEGFYELAIDGKCQLFFNFEEGRGPLGGDVIITHYLL